MKYLIMLLLVSGIIGCATYKPLPGTQSDVDRASTTFPGITLEDLSRGASLYEVKCSSCHGLKKPGSRTEAQWREIVPRMAKKANKQRQEIDPNAQEDILKYLITMSSAPTDKAK
jgi:mono/diheme cytochrome c family protein